MYSFILLRCFLASSVGCTIHICTLPKAHSSKDGILRTYIMQEQRTLFGVGFLAHFSGFFVHISGKIVIKLKLCSPECTGTIFIASLTYETFKKRIKLMRTARFRRTYRLFYDVTISAGLHDVPNMSLVWRHSYHWIMTSPFPQVSMTSRTCRSYDVISPTKLSIEKCFKLHFLLKISIRHLAHRLPRTRITLSPKNGDVSRGGFREDSATDTSEALAIII